MPQEDIEELYRIYPDLPRTHLSGCPSCGKNNGYGIDGTLVLDGVEWTCNCHDQLQRYKHYLNAGIGATYQFLSWDDFKGNQDALEWVVKWVNDVDEQVEVGRGLFIWSQTNGTGKTFAAALALKECVVKGYRSYMTTFQNMLSSMKSGWKDADYDRWYRNKIDSAQVLLIDDVGKEMMEVSNFNNDFAKQTMDSLLRTRTQQGRPTLFTSNYSPSELTQYYGKAVVSLLNENTCSVNMSGDDYRPMHVGKAKGRRRIY